MTYDDVTIAKVGDVVAVASGEGSERYIIIGPDQGNFAKLLLIGTVQKEDSPLGVCRYAEISVREGSEVWEPCTPLLLRDAT
ncbi:MAG: hypothetical protein AUF67_15170 [Acidobacteria bacterium 13_1_20CM_58_21]|nr:MAG: hypothetical protein AUH05_03780 [Ktedonobacter sp. 13_2_20CM_53_11]OLD79682.1 MAG: hypothetical protein AUF67_15170 [Acidobacteria bacterium 13_1_20CM_58_21]